MWQISVNEVYDYVRQYGDVRTNEPQFIDPIPDDSLFAADFTGCHCLLIKTDVLRAMSEPWFSGIPGQEDRYFCLNANNEGYQVCVDFSTVVGHMTGERSLGVRDFVANYLLELALEGEENVQGE